MAMALPAVRRVTIWFVRRWRLRGEGTVGAPRPRHTSAAGHQDGGTKLRRPQQRQRNLSGVTEAVVFMKWRRGRGRGVNVRLEMMSREKHGRGNWRGIRRWKMRWTTTSRPCCCERAGCSSTWEVLDFFCQHMRFWRVLPCAARPAFVCRWVLSTVGGGRG